MNKNLFKLFILLLIHPYLLAGCDLSSPKVDSGGSVTVIAPIDVELFSEDASLRVRLWNAEQLEIIQNTANCAVTYNQQTQTEEVHCPEGIEYQEVTPEEFSFSIQEIGTSIEVRSEMIRVGEKYRLLISGSSNDNCNTTSADVVDIAGFNQVVLEDLMWMTTGMACP